MLLSSLLLPSAGPFFFSNAAARALVCRPPTPNSLATFQKVFGAEAILVVGSADGLKGTDLCVCVCMVLAAAFVWWTRGLHFTLSPFPSSSELTYVRRAVAKTMRQEATFRAHEGLLLFPCLILSSSEMCPFCCALSGTKID